MSRNRIIAIIFGISLAFGLVLCSRAQAQEQQVQEMSWAEWFPNLEADFVLEGRGANFPFSFYSFRGAMKLQIKGPPKTTCALIEESYANEDSFDQDYIPKDYCLFFAAVQIMHNLDPGMAEHSWLQEVVSNVENQYLYHNDHGSTPPLFHYGSLFEASSFSVKFADDTGSQEGGGQYQVDDRDGDLIHDAKDKCPYEVEDIDGYQDEDGCPDPDNDSDGVPDYQDSCPDEPGSVSNFGCPADSIGRLIVTATDNLTYQVLGSNEKPVIDGQAVDEESENIHLLLSGTYSVVSGRNIKEEVDILPGAEYRVVLDPYGFSGPDLVIIVEDLDQDPPPKVLDILNIGLSYHGQIGSHGEGVDEFTGLQTRGAQHGFRVSAGARLGQGSRFLVRGAFIWGYDNLLPESKEICMASQVGGGGMFMQGVRVWTDIGGQIRGVAKYPEYGGEIRNMYKGPFVSHSVDFRLDHWRHVHILIEPGWAWSVVGTYSLGYTSANWFHLSVGLEI